MVEPTDPAPTSTGRRIVKWVVPVGIAIVGVAILVLVLGRDDSLRLDDLPQGVSAHQLGGDDVFIMREGMNVRVFLSDARHLPEDTLWWCPNEQVFVEVEHGSTFDRQGRKIGGPAQGGLNQYRVRVDDGKIVVDRSEIVVGELTPRGESPQGIDDADFSRPYNSGPGSFCNDPVASPPEAAQKGDPGVTVGGH